MQWHRDVVQLDAAECGCADAHARVGLDGESLGRGLDDEQRRPAVQLGGDDEQLGVGGSGHQGLDAREPVAARSAHRGGLECGRIEQGVRLGDRDARLWDVLAGELAEVGGLLVGATPVRQRRRDAAGGQDRQGEAHVAVGKGLGDECVGHRAAVRGDAVEVLGDVDRRDAELGGLGDQVGRVRRGLVGVVRGGTEQLLGELGDRLDDHLLFVVGRQVEVVRSARLQAGGGLADALDPLELAGGCSERRERRLDAVAQAAVERIAQPVLVQELLPEQRCDQRQPDGGRGALGFLKAYGALRTGALAARLRPIGRRKGVGHVCSLASLGQCVVTLSYSRVR